MIHQLRLEKKIAQGASLSAGSSIKSKVIRTFEGPINEPLGSRPWPPNPPPARLLRATHLHRRVDLQYLLLAFDLPDADLAGELRRGVAVSL